MWVIGKSILAFVLVVIGVPFMLVAFSTGHIYVGIANLVEHLTGEN